MKQLLLILVGMLLLSSVRAYTVNVELWEDLGQTVPYTNEFMICYLTNTTHVFWADYDLGDADIITLNNVTPQSYTLGCCDNCYFANDNLETAPNSFFMTIDTDKNISANVNLDYYIGEEIRVYRTYLGVIQSNNRLDQNMETVAGFIIVLICTIVIPLLIQGLMPTLDAKSVFAVGGALGYMVGLGIAGGFSLLSIPILSIFGILGLLFFISILGGLARNG